MELYIGKIIFWNGIFGFMSYGEESVFFHRSSLVDQNIHLLDEVSFNIEIINNYNKDVRREHI